MSKKEILSIGIDVGTTTTQLILSKLVIINRAPASQVPTYEFVERKILYKSPVRFTPINYEGIIDGTLLENFVYSELKNADICIDKIETGAIIITGETAKAQNAKKELLNLSQKLGEFIVATAGPHLESIIAGRGSGAETYSKVEYKKVLNIDIGGGTSNYVVFDSGKVVDTACLNIGGRLIERDKFCNIKHIHHAAKKVIDSLLPNFSNSKRIDEVDLIKITDLMAKSVIEVITGDISEVTKELLMTEPLNKEHDFDAIFISGGVGQCFYNDNINQGSCSYEDIGPLLAKSLKRSLSSLKGYGINFKLEKPTQTLRATVIGAGAYSLSLSGSTIWLGDIDLPIKNIPTVHPQINWADTNESNISSKIETSCKRFDLLLDKDLFAIVIDDSMPLKYVSVNLLSKGIADFYKKNIPKNSHVIVILKNDIGKALGMELNNKLKDYNILIIDEVFAKEGDYIDIGNSYFGGEIVPLTIKSLAFPEA